MPKSHTTSAKVTLRLESEADTKKLASQLAKLNLSGSVWLSGDLGAGKTTLTRYWLEALGHRGAVKSPTYTLVEPYEIEIAQSKQLMGADDWGDKIIKSVYHADLYRLQDPEELSFIGFDEYQDDPKALLIIEWASRARDYLVEPVLKIEINPSDDRTAATESRQVQLTCTAQGQAAGVDLSELTEC